MYKVEVRKSAQKELSQIPLAYNRKIAEVIDSLSEEPRPLGVKKLQGDEAYRIRVGDYRIIYTIEDVIKIVEVIRIGHRKDVYR